MLSKASVACSILLVTINIVFLYLLVTEKAWISSAVMPGLTTGMIAFALIILFAVFLTWVYVLLINLQKG